LALAVLILATAPACAQPDRAPASASLLPAEPDDLRMGDYNSEVPAGVSGAQVIVTAEELERFIAAAQPALLDVYPAPNRPEDLGEDVLWFEPSRATLPEAFWLANVGMGPAPAALETLLADTLEAVTAGDRSFPVVIFCEPRCWHSWNAAKRAVRLGYDNVHWYKGGVEAWRTAGLPLASVRPVRPQ
jgi:PQQ-dependent catabolism-associated CXXCW motif protein